MLKKKKQNEKERKKNKYDFQGCVLRVRNICFSFHKLSFVRDNKFIQLNYSANGCENKERKGEGSGRGREKKESKGADEKKGKHRRKLNLN